MFKAFFLVLLFIISCSQATQENKATIEEFKEDSIPRIVAILPFESVDKDITISEQLRKTFYNHFSGKNYTNVELSLIDEKLYQLEKTKGKNFKDLTPKEICESIGCDGLIYGKITDYQKVYAVAYSQLGIEAEIIMYNVRSDKEILRIKESVRYHEGGIPMSPLSAVMTAVSTALNLREIQSIRLFNELCYKLTEKIPSLPNVTSYKLPIIKEVLTNVKESPFGKGKIIRVGLEGDSGMIASFDIGNFKKGILMREVKKGVYTGEYVVMEGDNVKNTPIIVYLKKPGGYENRWIDVSGLITIDTEAPPPVKNLKGKGYSDRIELKWDSLKNIPDLKGYEILRSEQPLSGYKTLGVTELESFEDRNIETGKVYYYKLKAIDMAGNESLLSEALKAQSVLKEPVTIDGVIDKDTVLSGVYRVKEKLVIKKGFELKVEDGTIFYLGKDALIQCEGKLIIEGKNDGVEFLPEIEGEIWEGFRIVGGYIEFNKCKIKNAKLALGIKDAVGKIENTIITNSETAIKISLCSKFDISKVSIFNNKLGIEIEKSLVNMKYNEIFQNETGIKLSIFSGEIVENNIFNNAVNIMSKENYKISPNYFGSINKEEMKLTNIVVEKVLNSKYPEGKIVEVQSDPYLGVSEEERRKKSTEFLIEAGNYFRQRNYGRALIKFEEALKAFPSPDIYYYIAICYKEMGELNNTIKYLEEGYKKFPKDPTIVKALGLVYYENNKNDKAEKFFQELLKLNPEDNQIKFILEKIKNN